jgi:hypothetical protein
MKTILGQLDAQTAAMWSPSRTYHLEVKTTAGASSEACFVSQNQVDMVSLEDGVVSFALNRFTEYRVDASL